MKIFTLKHAFMALLTSVSFTLYSQNVAINLSGAPSASTTAILDLSDASNSALGMLLPNVSLSSPTSISPFASTPTAGMIVWNTNGGMPLGVGYYYWTG